MPGDASWSLNTGVGVLTGMEVEMASAAKTYTVAPIRRCLSIAEIAAFVRIDFALCF